MVVATAAEGQWLGRWQRLAADAGSLSKGSEIKEQATGGQRGRGVVVTAAAGR